MEKNDISIQYHFMQQLVNWCSEVILILSIWLIWPSIQF